MRICKNNFDICLGNVHCMNSYFKVGHICQWVSVARNHNIPGCGGIKLHTLSDIFTL
jgi:hypothetical protein